MGQTILFAFFLTLGTCGVWLIWKRTGNYDVDFFTKIIGWILLIPAIIGIFELIKMYIW
tara:strand:+ start:85 stop:261 length:177 start_codon:yes stop_codon:yes gene_type:complete